MSQWPKCGQLLRFGDQDEVERKLHSLNGLNAANSYDISGNAPVETPVDGLNGLNAANSYDVQIASISSVEKKSQWPKCGQLLR